MENLKSMIFWGKKIQEPNPKDSGMIRFTLFLHWLPLTSVLLMD